MNGTAAMALAAIAGCTWGGPRAPALDGVEPASIMAGEVTVLRLAANDLDAFDGVVDFDRPSRQPACDWFRVELRAPDGEVVPLEEVVRVGDGALRGRVPASAKRNVYDVWLIDPSGGEAVLPGAFTIDRCPPGAECRNGDTCSRDDTCHSTNVCAPGAAQPDGTACTFPCTWGSVPGSCDAGVCVPIDGACPAAPTSCGGG